MTWLDASIGWTREFNTITTWMPDDPAIDLEKSNIKEYFEDNLNTEHLVVNEGMTPVDFEITLPTPAQWSSIIPYMRDALDSPESSSSVACYKLFEMCVSVDGFEKERREGFYRLPNKFMDWVVRVHPSWIDMVGGFLMLKYQLTDEEKKQ